jgi:hypothetical protein
MYKKLAVLFVLAAVPVMALAAPAAAVAPEGYITQSKEVTFHWDGVDYSCEVLGVLSWRYISERDETQIDAHNSGQGDNQCSNPQVAIHNAINVTWTTKEQERPQSSRSFGRGADVSLNIVAAGEVTSLSGFHNWSYNCEEEPDDACGVSVETKAK